MSFTRAIVRRPGPDFASGLTSAAGAPDLATALQQHGEYCAALQACGLELIHIEPEPGLPDGTFVEDTAVTTARGAILTRPGAPSRSGEVASVARTLDGLFAETLRIAAPGTVDGGDVCEADGHFLIGVSARTNEAGARQLAQHLRRLGFTAGLVDIRASPRLLHLKTGIAYLGDGVWVVDAGVVSALPALREMGMRDVIAVAAEEAYAANCVRLNDAVLVPAGYPRLAAALRDRGFRPLPLAMSEFQKMDGGLSCLSLRF